MSGSGPWIVGGLAGLAGFFGLFAASRAADSAFYVGGWIIFAASLAFIFSQIKGHYDRKDHSGS